MVYMLGKTERSVGGIEIDLDTRTRGKETYKFRVGYGSPKHGMFFSSRVIKDLLKNDYSSDNRIMGESTLNTVIPGKPRLSFYPFNSRNKALNGLEKKGVASSLLKRVLINIRKRHGEIRIFPSGGTIQPSLGIIIEGRGLDTRDVMKKGISVSEFISLINAYQTAKRKKQKQKARPKEKRKEVKRILRK